MRINYIKKTIIATALLSLVFLLGGCSGQRVQTVSDENEANQILDILREHGIIASKVPAGENEKKVYEIYVNGGDIEYGAAIQLMEDHCLPQRMPPEVESSGLVSSLEVEKAQQLRRTKINLESQLRKLPGATCVDISIVPPDDKSLSLNPYKASATVLLKHKNEDFGLNVDQIARMVARGVQGLSVDNVHVTLTRQPLRPLPDINRGRTMRRIIYVSIIGVTTILIFVGLVWFLRKRKAPDKSEEAINQIDDENVGMIEDADADEDEVQLIDEGEPIDLDKSDEPVN